MKNGDFIIIGDTFVRQQDIVSFCHNGVDLAISTLGGHVIDFEVSEDAYGEFLKDMEIECETSSTNESSPQEKATSLV